VVRLPCVSRRDYVYPLLFTVTIQQERRVKKVVITCTLFLFCLGFAHASVTVGNCKSASSPYSTISQAITASPANGVIYVCPGTYPEQLIITKPLSIVGLSIPNQPGVTITAPTTGLPPTAGTESSYTQILVNQAGGPVNLSNLSIVAGGLKTDFGVFNVGIACEFFSISDSTGITYLDTPGILDNLNITGQFGGYYGNCGGPGCLPPTPNLIPNCGSGILLNNAPDTVSVVRKSVVNYAGLYGIYATGQFAADHNVVIVQGPFSIGISSGVNGLISNNSITASLYANSTGISGGNRVVDNIVQGGTIGITGASGMAHNTLINNSIGIIGSSTGNDAFDNLIDASSATYIDPFCEYEPYNPALPSCTTATIGIDLNCGSTKQLSGNGIVGYGIGLAGLKSGQTYPNSNLFAGVATTSTSCGQ
jgi:hypothetical protein